MLQLNVIGKTSSTAILIACPNSYMIERPETGRLREPGLLVRVPPTSQFKKGPSHPLKLKILNPRVPLQLSAGRYPPIQYLTQEEEQVIAETYQPEMKYSMSSMRSGAWLTLRTSICTILQSRTSPRPPCRDDLAEWLG